MALEAMFFIMDESYTRLCPSLAIHWIVPPGGHIWVIPRFNFYATYDGQAPASSVTITWSPWSPPLMEESASQSISAAPPAPPAGPAAPADATAADAPMEDPAHNPASSSRQRLRCF